MPVHRENCSDLSSLEEDRESMNITWHLSYTGRIPGKFLLADNSKTVTYRLANTSSDASEHDTAVLIREFQPLSLTLTHYYSFRRYLWSLVRKGIPPKKMVTSVFSVVCTTLALQISFINRSPAEWRNLYLGFWIFTTGTPAFRPSLSVSPDT